MSGYPWYGGYLGQNLFSFTDPIDRQNKNNFELFSAGGMDFIIIHLEYDMPGYSVAWANRVLAATRTGGRSSARTCSSTPPAPADVRPEPDDRRHAGVDGLDESDRPELQRVPGAERPLPGRGQPDATRTPAASRSTSSRPTTRAASNGGDGWLRYMTFKPAENKIYVYTFSPTLDSGLGQFETDANSQFVLDYNMQGTPFTHDRDEHQRAVRHRHVDDVAGPHSEHSIRVVRDGQRRHADGHRTDMDVHDGAAAGVHTDVHGGSERHHRWHLAAGRVARRQRYDGHRRAGRRLPLRAVE